MTLPRTLLLAAAIAAPAVAIADGATTVVTEAPVVEVTEATPTTAEPISETPVEPGLELPETAVEFPETAIEPIDAVPSIDIGEAIEHWDDCPGCGMG